MTDTLKPRDAKDVEEAVRWAFGAGTTLEIIGHGSKRPIGRAAQSDLFLDLSGLTGISLYEPEELVLTAKAGTPLAEIEALVASNGQGLAFEPLDYGPILGLPAGRGTLGGALAANLSGPRRIKAGAARDHFLGFCAVSGRGESFKSGGRVVKNVTGYDLCKLMCGSWGTLAAMTEVTIKVLPAAETEETSVVFGLDAAHAVKAMSIAMGSPCDVSGAAHLPGPVAQSAMVESEARTGVTALRLEGFAPSIAHRKRQLEALLRPFGAMGTLYAASSRSFWRQVRDAKPFTVGGSWGDRSLWRVSTAPTEAPELVRRIGGVSEIEALYDWAGGLIWLALPPGDDAGAGLVRTVLAGIGGHATLIRAPASVRSAVDVFEPLDPVSATLTRRVKEGFDPRGVLNPGRMYAGV